MRLTLNWISACSVHLSDLSIWYKFKGKYVSGALLCLRTYCKSGYLFRMMCHLATFTDVSILFPFVDIGKEQMCVQC